MKVENGVVKIADVTDNELLIYDEFGNLISRKHIGGIYKKFGNANDYHVYDDKGNRYEIIPFSFTVIKTDENGRSVILVKQPLYLQIFAVGIPSFFYVISIILIGNILNAEPFKKITWKEINDDLMHLLGRVKDKHKSR